MTTAVEILDKLKAMSKPENLSGMARYGIKTENRLGITMPELRKLAKETGKDHALAMELWHSGIAEARIIAGLVAEPEMLTEQQMDGMVKDIDSWDIDDQTNMNLFEKTPYAWKKVREWIICPEEFVKRTALSLIACLAWHSKSASDQQFVDLFPLLAEAAQDERKSIQKAVSWAIRNVGKRNPRLNQHAIELAREVQKLATKPARWIASDVLRELTGPAVQRRLGKKQTQKLK